MNYPLPKYSDIARCDLLPSQASLKKIEWQKRGNLGAVPPTLKEPRKWVTALLAFSLKKVKIADYGPKPREKGVVSFCRRWNNVVPSVSQVSP